MEHFQNHKLIVLLGPHPNQEHTLSKATTVIGRDYTQGVDVIIPSPTVSRRHVQIIRQKDQWLVQDLGSSNGTILNGERLTADPHPLKPGDRIQLAPSVVLSFTAEPILAQVEPHQTETPETILGEIQDLRAPTTPPQLIIAIAGEASQTYALTKSAYTLGRSPDNDIVVDSRVISRRHARLERVDGGFAFVNLPDATNAVHFQGRPLTSPHRLRHNDILRVGDANLPGLMVTMTYSSPDEAARVGESVVIHFGEKNQLQIGRDPGNDVVLEAPNISRFHAQVERIGKRYRLLDLRSANGTFVNDQRIEDEVWLSPDDTIRIGPYRFEMGEDELAQFDESSGLRADVINLNKWVRRDLNILQNVSVIFKPREFITIVGQSGGGKSTLLDAIAGYHPATHGRVLVNDIDVYQNFDAVRNNIGYVPQRDIIHMELSVYEALDYAAQLRMPPDTTPEERHERVMEVMEDLDLAHRKDLPVSGLSGGQQKRVSIGVELLTKPGLFFLDEATSGLDPGTETSLMQLLRRLADQGCTIVLVTHATKNVMLADKVVFLARGGYLAWFGPPDEALFYFDKYRSEQEQRTQSMEFDQIYAILENPENGTPQDWAERFQAHPAYIKYIAQPLAGKRNVWETDLPPSRPVATPVHQVHGPTSSIRQFLILSSRNLRILLRDKVSLALMLGAAPLVSMLDVLLSFLMGKNQFDFVEGNAANLIMTFFLLVIFAIFVGALSQMREIVKENDIYKRERLVNLKIAPYVLSKVWVAALLALYHAAAYVIIHNLAYGMSGSFLDFLFMYATMVLAAMAGMMLGLFASALSPNANAVPMIVILLIMPQVVLSGALVPLPSAVSAPAASRWTFESLMAISAIGSDVAADPCWDLPVELREVMTIEDRSEHCNCMGLNILREESCAFPGVGQFYDDVIEQPEPEEPPPLRDKPSEPEIPPEPVKPEDESDSVAMADYFEALEDYQDKATLIQDVYKAEMKAFEAEAKLYQKEMEAYQEDLLDWEITRAAATDAAEGLVESFREEVAWTFVDKNDTATFLSKIFNAWLAQALIIMILLLGVLYMVKRKDVI
ncbi:MAG: FHA domain-containing protein [Anaerolineales bacterium]|nr:FHA domain-containing protein [Anaerolineales bacterium]